MKPGKVLSAAVRSYLSEAGIPDGSDQNPGIQTVVDMLESSWSLEDAANVLGCTVDDVAARILRRELYGFPLAHSLRVPTWQVTGGQPIPGLIRLLDQVPPAVHPAMLQAHMTTPDPQWQDLTPVEWLLTGGAVEPLVDWMRDRWHRA